MEKKTERMSLRLLPHLKVTRGEGYSRAKEIETDGLGVGGKPGKKMNPGSQLKKVFPGGGE